MFSSCAWRAVQRAQTCLLTVRSGLRRSVSSTSSKFLTHKYSASLYQRKYPLHTIQKNSLVTFSFIEPDGEEVEVECEEGTNLLDLAHDNDIEMEGACGGECACSTCHVILQEDLYERLLEAEEIDEEEEDMLDLALGLTDTSRLGCQVRVKTHFDGAKIKLPKDVESFY